MLAGASWKVSRCETTSARFGERLESRASLLLPPLVNSPLLGSPSYACRPRAPHSEQAVLATQPASGTFSLRVLFPGGSRADERVSAEGPRTRKRVGVNNHGRAALPSTPIRGRFAGAVHRALVSAGEALSRGGITGCRWIPVPTTRAAPNWFLAIQVVGRRSVESGWLALRPREHVGDVDGLIKIFGEHRSAFLGSSWMAEC